MNTYLKWSRLGLGVIKQRRKRDHTSILGVKESSKNQKAPGCLSQHKASVTIAQLELRRFRGKGLQKGAAGLSRIAYVCRNLGPMEISADRRIPFTSLGLSAGRADGGRGGGILINALC